VTSDRQAHSVWRSASVDALNDASLSNYGRRGAGRQKDTAWNYRDAKWAEVIVGVDPDPANNEKIISWTKSYYDAVHPYSAGGAYVNFFDG